MLPHRPEAVSFMHSFSHLFSHSLNKNIASPCSAPSTERRGDGGRNSRLKLQCKLQPGGGSVRMAGRGGGREDSEKPVG